MSGHALIVPESRNRYNSGMTDSRQGRRPTPEERQARRQLAQARAAKEDRKRRTRQLIQMGGVMAAYGFTTPEQVEEIVEAVLHSKSGPARVLRAGVQPTDRWPRGGS